MKRILQIPARPGARLVAEFAQTSTAHLSDSMERLYAATGLRPMHRDGTLAGPAFTVKTAPGDNLLVHKALDMAQAGDVVVVDAGGFCEQAVIGEIMAGWAARRGIAGLVIWGAIRDSAEIRAGSFPVFACGVTHRGPYKDGPGEINVPIALAGMPEMDGYEVARTIRAHAAGEVPLIVALTGWGQESDRRRSREAGFDHHLVKPADLATLERVLASRRAPFSREEASWQ